MPAEGLPGRKFAGREFIWSDPLVQGVGYGAGTTHVTLFQPYLGAKFDLPRGFKLSGLLSQRWRDGKEDFKGFWYDKNIAISHEDYGSLAHRRDDHTRLEHGRLPLRQRHRRG